MCPRHSRQQQQHVSAQLRPHNHLLVNNLPIGLDLESSFNPLFDQLFDVK